MVQGIYEWIVETGGNVTHRVFIPNGKVSSILNKWYIMNEK
jgi:hypothetical protein